MSEIRVGFAELDLARQNVAGTASRISTALDDLKRFLAPLVATWDGQAAQEYQVRQRQWDAAATDLAAVLAQIGVALGTAHESYVQVEHVNARRWA